MKKLLTYFAFIRMHNCFMAAITVAVGQYLSPSSSQLPLNHIAMAAAFFVCAYGNIMNDIVDAESDKTNHPKRAIPSGKISIKSARTTAVFFLLISIALGVMLNAFGFAIVIVALILLILYNIWLKHSAFWGNAIVSALAALTLILGGATSGFSGIFEMPGAALAAVLAFLMHFGREVVKDIQDYNGDREAGSRTAPIRFGAVKPLLLVFGIFLLSAVLSVLFYMKGWFNVNYLYMTVGLIYIPMIIQFVWLGWHPDKRKCAIVSTLLKAQMVLGIVALILGKNY